MSDSRGPLGEVLVIIPTYNESENIGSIVGRLRAAVPAAHVLIADDNSPDGTGLLADELAERDDHVHVLHRAGKQGLAAAYIAGFKWGLDRGYGVLVEHDADGSHQPEQLPLLLEALKDADMVKGSRYVKGGTVVNWPKSREILSRGGNLWTQLVLGVHLKDATGGFNAFRAETLRGIGLDSLEASGYAFQVDLAWRAIQKGYKVVEVPIEFIERQVGASKMSRNIVVEALALTTRWGIKHRAEQLKALVGKAGVDVDKAGKQVNEVSHKLAMEASKVASDVAAKVAKEAPKLGEEAAKAAAQMGTKVGKLAEEAKTKLDTVVQADLQPSDDVE